MNDEVEFSVNDEYYVTAKFLGPYVLRVAPSGEAFLHGAIDVGDNQVIRFALPVNRREDENGHCNIVDSLRHGVAHL